MFLSAGFGCSNRRRMTDLTVDSQFFHQLQKPLHRPRRFDPYAHRTWKRGIKLPHVVAFVCEGPIHHFPRQSVQHRHGLLASVQITSYNLHLGLLRSEHCWGEHRTVYSGRSEAGVVMPSIRTWQPIALPKLPNLSRNLHITFLWPSGDWTEPTNELLVNYLKHI